MRRKFLEALLSEQLSEKNRSRIFTPRRPPTSPELWRAYELLLYGCESVDSLWKLYLVQTKQRGRGGPTHEEQDVLRSVLVMACATLDAVAKTAIVDAYPKVVSTSHDAMTKVHQFVERELLKRINDKAGELARALLSDNPKSYLVQVVVEELSGGSLQSEAALARVLEFCGVEKARVIPPGGILRRAFEARNQIIHELDALGDVLGKTRGRKAGGRVRRPRKKADIKSWSEAVLGTAEKIVIELDRKLSRPESNV